MYLKKHLILATNALITNIYLRSRNIKITVKYNKIILLNSVFQFTDNFIVENNKCTLL